MKYEDIIKTVSKELGLSYNIVDRTYKAFWLFVRNTITPLPLKQNLSEDEFKLLRTNFNIPSLGKLTCTFDRYKGVKKRLEYLKKLKENG